MPIFKDVAMQAAVPRRPGLAPGALNRPRPGEVPTPAAFATILTDALMTRQNRPQALPGRRQEFPRYRALGQLKDANLSRLIQRTALSRRGSGAQPGKEGLPRAYSRHGGRASLL